MALGMDLIDILFSWPRDPVEYDEKGIPINAECTANHVKKLVEDLEKQEQEKRKRCREESLGSEFRSEGKNEVKEELDEMAREVETVAPPLTSNDVLSNSKVPDPKIVYLIDKTQKLHIAAKENDISTIKMFIESNYELNDEDSSEATPLLISVINENYEAARMLFNAHIEVLLKKLFGSNPSSRLWHHAEKRNVQMVHANLFTKKMIERNFDAVRIGKILAQVHRNLNQVMQFRDPIITKSYLQSFPDEVEPFLSYEGMVHFDVEQVRLIINYGPLAEERKRLFVRYFVDDILEYQKTSEGRDSLKKLACREIVDEDFAICLENNLQTAFKRNFKVILQYQFHKIAESTCGRDLSRICFGNTRPKVVRLLNLEEIDVNKRYYGGDTLLHVGSRHCSIKSIRLLLSKNADPNALNDDHETPLSLALKCDHASSMSIVKSVKLLLLAGASLIAVTDHFEDTFYGYDKIDNEKQMVKLLLSQIVVYEATGWSIEKPINIFTSMANQETKKILEECRQEIDRLKKQTFYDEHHKTFKINFNIVEILAKKTEKIVCHVNEECIQLIAKVASSYMKINRKSLNSLYREFLRQKVKDIIELYHCRQRAIQFVCQFTTIGDPNNLVVHKIVDYFTARDLRLFKDSNQKM